MRALEPDELVELASRFGVEVGDDEVETLRAAANGLLDGIDRVFEVDPGQIPTDVDGRQWERPRDDPLDATAVECTVPPTAAGGLLADVAVGVKDNVAVAGVPMACGASFMRGFVPRTDATVVRRLLAAGGSVTAKTIPDEMAASAWGGFDEGQVRNPHDPDRVAGGSSGGSAVAVATGRVDVALGTDTGGSVRIPAALCGVVGLKPTYGLVSLYGVVENTYVQDHVGPLASTTADAAGLLEAIAGPDLADPATLAAAGREGYRADGFVAAVAAAPDPADLRLGILEDGFGDGVDGAVEAATEARIDRLEDAGATIESRSIAGFEYRNPIKDALSYAELAVHWLAAGVPYRRGGTVDESYLSRFASRRAAGSGDLGVHYRAKLLAGAALVDREGGRHYVRARVARERLREAVVDALDGVDALVTPTVPGIAPRVAEGRDPGFSYGRNTRLANVTRQPAVTLPNGTVDGLPVGIQLLAGEFEERSLLAGAAAVEGGARSEGP